MINTITKKLESEHVKIKNTLCIYFNQFQTVAIIYDFDYMTFIRKPVGVYVVSQDQFLRAPAA